MMRQKRVWALMQRGRGKRTRARLEARLRELTSQRPIAQAIMAVETGDRSFRWFGAECLPASGGGVVERTPVLLASIDGTVRRGRRSGQRLSAGPSRIGPRAALPPEERHGVGDRQDDQDAADPPRP